MVTDKNSCFYTNHLVSKNDFNFLKAIARCELSYSHLYCMYTDSFVICTLTFSHAECELDFCMYRYFLLWVCFTMIQDFLTGIGSVY